MRLRITASENIDENTLREATSALRSYFKRYKDSDETQFVAARYEYRLNRIGSWWNETRYEWSIVPLDGEIQEENYKVFRTPKELTIEEIPNDPNLVFRGMAWEEWQFIRKNKYVESTGSHNLDQKGLTFFGDASSAEYYGSGFAPAAYKPSYHRPGVVIAVSRELALDHTDLPNKIPVGEFAVQGRLPIEAIQHVWFLIPTKIRFGYVEVIVKTVGEKKQISEGSRSSPSISYSVLQIH